MNAEFNWWLLIVGLVVGAGLVWLVIADWSRREQDVSDEERSAESAWIAREMHQRGEHVDPEATHEILALHREYLRRTGDLDAAGDSPDFDDGAWPEEVGESPELAGGAAWPVDTGWDTETPQPADGARLAYSDSLDRERASEADWNVRRMSAERPSAEARPAEHRSVRSGPSSPRGGPEADTGSDLRSP